MNDGIWMILFSDYNNCTFINYRLGGLVLDAAVGVFNGFVVFQPIINGIGGNLVSVQASKISTMLHQSSIIGIVPPHTEICEPPWRALIKGGTYEVACVDAISSPIFITIKILINPIISSNSSVCQNSTYSDIDVNTWSNIIHLCSRLYPYDSFDNWNTIRIVVFDS